MRVTLTNPTKTAANRVHDIKVGTYFYTNDPKSLFVKAYGIIVEVLNGATHTMRKFKEVNITPVEVENIVVRRLV